MYNTQNSVSQFTSSFDEIYVALWLRAIKTQTVKHLYVYVADDNSVRFITDDQKDVNIANCKLLVHLYFDCREFSNSPLDLNALIQFLSSEEKSEYIKKQNILLEDDAWLFYDVRKMMLQWIKDTYPQRFDEYIASLIEKRLKSFKEAYVFKDALSRLEKLANDNYTQSTSSKKRDIVKELEHEHDELTDKIVKLEKFIEGSDVFKTLPSVEQTAMKRQLRVMKVYAEQLLIRVSSIIKRSEQC